MAETHTNTYRTFCKEVYKIDVKNKISLLNMAAQTHSFQSAQKVLSEMSTMMDAICKNYEWNDHIFRMNEVKSCAPKSEKA